MPAARCFQRLPWRRPVLSSSAVQHWTCRDSIASALRQQRAFLGPWRPQLEGLDLICGIFHLDPTGVTLVPVLSVVDMLLVSDSGGRGPVATIPQRQLDGTEKCLSFRYRLYPLTGHPWPSEQWDVTLRLVNQSSLFLDVGF